jgi:hypothetical protein
MFHIAGDDNMAKTVLALILESGATGGDLVYVRSTRGVAVPGARLTTAPDLLGLKAEAVGKSEPLIASGPAIDDSFADVVIDADATEPTIVRAKTNGGASVDTSHASA